MDGTYKKTVTPPPLPVRAIPAPPVSGAAAMSTPQLVKEIVHEVKDLAQKQIELAMAEARADLRREAAAAASVGVGAVGAAITVTLLLVTVALALSAVMSPWLAGLVVSGVALLGTAAVSYLGWRKRVKAPLWRTRRGLQRDARLVKEGGAA